MFTLIVELHMMPVLGINTGRRYYKAREFNQLKQSISSLSPKQKVDLEQCLLHPSAELEVIKFLNEHWMLARTVTMVMPTNGAPPKGDNVISVSRVIKHTMH
jgi:hypothetical protein